MSKIKRTFPVVGLGCAACVARVEGRLKEQNGVCSANVSLASNTAQVEYDNAVVKAADLKKAVKDAGYDLIVPDDADDDADPDPDSEEEIERQAEEQQAKDYRRMRRDMWLAIILAAAVMVIGFGFVEFKGKGAVLLALATVSVFWCGRRFIRGAIAQAKHLVAGMDALVALSTVVSWLFSLFNLCFPQVWTSKGLEANLYFDSCSMIVAFILIGRVLEAQAKHGTTEAVRNLMDLQPRSGKVKPGDVVKVKPGQRVPVDGVVCEGSSFVDESMLTGEPIPVEKLEGAKVYAGSMNQKGSFKVRAEKTGGDTMLSSIVRMVKEAQGSKAKIQNIVDKVAAVFVPVIMLIALAAFFFWTFSPSGGFAKGLLTMVSVLVIACPCSLGLAVPTAIIAGIGRGAQDGVLIKDADALHLAGKIDTVVLDKTGTLTLGNPTVTDSFWYDSSMKGALKAIEIMSEHPLAEAIVKNLQDVASVEISDFKAIPGKGCEAICNGEKLTVSNESEEPSSLVDEWLKQGKTLVYFSGEGRLIAVYAIADELKSTSADAVAMLSKLGITTCMLTGDNEAAALEIAKKAGIPEVKAGVLPDQKAEYVKQLQAAGKKVAMVGDGINDSAALALADLSVAMGKGSDIAMKTAMVTIVNSDLLKLSDMVRLSRKTRTITRENLFWAFIYNIIAVPMAAGLFGFSLNPMIAAACMAFSSVCVVTNSLRLRSRKL